LLLRFIIWLIGCAKSSFVSCVQHQANLSKPNWLILLPFKKITQLKSFIGLKCWWILANSKHAFTFLEDMWLLCLCLWRKSTSISMRMTIWLLIAIPNTCWTYLIAFVVISNLLLPISSKLVHSLVLFTILGLPSRERFALEKEV
jgi:hypothetical protein